MTWAEGGNAGRIGFAAVSTWVFSYNMGYVGQSLQPAATASTGSVVALYGARVAAQGVLSGLHSVARGGKFTTGLIAGSITAAAAPLIGKLPITPVGRIALAAAIGGASAELGGGKFINGAYSGAFLQTLIERAAADGDADTAEDAGTVDEAKAGAASGETVRLAMADKDSDPLSCTMMGHNATEGATNICGGGAGGAKIWSKTNKRSRVRNALEHWKDHRKEFPEFKNAKEYVEGARKLLNNPPEGSLVKTRPNGDTLIYHPKTNTFGVKNSEGVPRTMFRPTDRMKYWNDQ